MRLFILLAVALAVVHADNCAKPLDMFAQCIVEIRKSKEFQTIIEKRLETLKSCGAGEETLKCLKVKSECDTVVEKKLTDSKERKEALSAAEKCWDKQKNDPLSGLDEIFQGLAGITQRIKGRPELAHPGEEELPPPPGSDESSWSPDSRLPRPGEDESSWSPDSHRPPIVGGDDSAEHRGKQPRPGEDESALPPDARNKTRPGSDKNSLPPEHRDKQPRPGEDESSWSPDSHRPPIVGGDESSWSPDSRRPRPGEDESSWAPHGHGPHPRFPFKGARGPHGKPHPYFAPIECRLDGVNETFENCTFDKIVNIPDIVKLAKALRDKLKTCKQTLPLECKPHGPGLFGCLASAYKPVLELGGSTYKECMGKAGFKAPERPPFPPMPFAGPAKNHTLFFFL